MRGQLKSGNGRSGCRRTLAAGYLGLAFTIWGVALGPGLLHAADKPASSPQLQVLENQIAGLQSQLTAKEAEFQAWEGKIGEIQAKIYGMGMAQDFWGATPGGSTALEQVGMELKKAQLSTQLKAAESQRDLAAQQVSSLRQQIAQLQASLSYWRNPLKSDLEDELTHLRNLMKQQPTKDDQGQLQWDIENTRRRIKELEDESRREQYGGGGASSSSSGQSVQPQSPSYTAPTQGYGTGSPAGQSPQMGAGGVYGYPGGYGTPPPAGGTPHDPLGGGGGHEGGGGGGSKPHGTGGTSGSQKPPKGTGPKCGPTTSCTCPDGKTGHIPCDKSKGKCHCGGG